MTSIANAQVRFFKDTFDTEQWELNQGPFNLSDSSTAPPDMLCDYLPIQSCLLPSDGFGVEPPLALIAAGADITREIPTFGYQSLKLFIGTFIYHPPSSNPIQHKMYHKQYITEVVAATSKSFAENTFNVGWCYIEYGSDELGFEFIEIDATNDISQASEEYEIDEKYDNQTSFKIILGNQNDKEENYCMFDSVQLYGIGMSLAPTPSPTRRPTTAVPTKRPTTREPTSVTNEPTSKPTIGPTPPTTQSPTTAESKAIDFKKELKYILVAVIFAVVY